MALLYGSITADFEKVYTDDLSDLNGTISFTPSVSVADKLDGSGSLGIESITADVVNGVLMDPETGSVLEYVPVLAHTQTDIAATVTWTVAPNIEGFSFPTKAINVDSGATVDYSEVPTEVTPGVTTVVLDADDVWRRWVGTQAEYDALPSTQATTLYVVIG